jgi:DNA-binding transcriptional MocR family regulator
MEDPGYPLTRTALGLAGMTVTAVPVDAKGWMLPLVFEAPPERLWQL